MIGLHFFNSILKKEASFGMSIDFVVVRGLSRGTSKVRVPLIVQKCISWLREKNAREVVGIFRISGFTGFVNELKQQFDKINDEEFNISPEEDVHCVCSVLKLYFRELPNPVISFSLYQSFLTAQTLSLDLKIIETKKLLEQLPVNHRTTLHYVAKFLREIADGQDVNKMTEDNLAIVFGPSLCRSEHEDAKEMFSSLKLQYGVIRDLIYYYSTYFPE